jgi:scyllo-inositol 2-dehydrogenase (NADP+)
MARVIILGLGIQGIKRRAIAGDEVVATVDPYNADADYEKLEDVPVDTYDAALACIPDQPKFEVLCYLLGAGKHVLVEKPLLVDDDQHLQRLYDLARSNRVVCYTAYNHRFEPHFVRLKHVIDSGSLGDIYSCRMFYGNGTARLVRDSAWRDKGAGVLPDLGSHLLDTALFWFGRPTAPLEIVSARCFENTAFDHVSFKSDGKPLLHMEMSLLSWRNHFYADIIAEKGSAHISSLCKWAPSVFTLRDRKIPSGRPEERSETLVQPDPTWIQEYEHFKKLCEDPEACDFGNLENDMWLNAALSQLAGEAVADANAR